MDFRITGLPAAPFLPFYAMTDAELLARGARRVVAAAADAPLMQPCRVSLRDSTPGEVSILLHHEHHAAPASPYRAGGPIYVRQGVTETARFVNHVPRAAAHPPALGARLRRRGDDGARRGGAGDRPRSGDRAPARAARGGLPARPQREAGLLLVPDRRRLSTGRVKDQCGLREEGGARRPPPPLAPGAGGG